jgi:hypothetical protein
MGASQATSHSLLECTSELPPKPAHSEKETTTKLANGVMLVKINRTTRELGLVVMSVGIFCRVFLHSSFFENILARSGASESERE